MNTKITVEILKTTAGVGKQGEIKEVSVAQARNQLIPQGIAKEYVQKSSGSSEDLKRVVHQNRHEIVKKLSGKTLTIEAKGSGSKIAGHFDSKDVAQGIKQSYQTKIPPEMIVFDGVKHPKKSGEYDIHIDIAEDAFVRMKLIITLTS